MLPTLPPASAGFSSSPVHMEFMVDRVALGLVFLPSNADFLSVTLIPPVLHIHISFICCGCCVNVATDSVVRYSTSSFWKESPVFIELEAVEQIWTQFKEKNLQPHQKLNPSASSSFHIDQNIVSLFFLDLMFGDYLIAADFPH
jgi:hypothetical protein